MRIVIGTAEFEAVAFNVPAADSPPAMISSGIRPVSNLGPDILIAAAAHADVQCGHCATQGRRRDAHHLLVSALSGAQGRGERAHGLNELLAGGSIFEHLFVDHRQARDGRGKSFGK